MSGHVVRDDLTMGNRLGGVWHVSGAGTEVEEAMELARASREVWTIVRVSRIDLVSMGSNGRGGVRSGGGMGSEGFGIDVGGTGESKRWTGSKNSAALWTKSTGYGSSGCRSG